MKVLKFNSSKQKIFFASDFHLSHIRDFIWKPRGFNTFESHTKAVIKGINEKVGADDILFYLGDFSLNSNPEETKNYFDQIACKNVYFIWGNHESSTRRLYDKAVADYFKVPPGTFDVYPFKVNNMTFLGNSAMIQIDNQLIVLSHFAHLVWDNMQHGAWNLCGHCHGNAPVINPECKEQKVLDIGVDNALKLTGQPCISFEEVKVVMDEKVFIPLDHHNEKTT